MVVLDTSTLIFWTVAPERLSKIADQMIVNADRICLSAISIWEIGVKVKKGKLDLPVSIREYTENLERTDRLEVLPVDARTWIQNLELDWDHQDPADRTIVATAELNSCPLVTSDATILNFYSQAVW